MEPATSHMKPCPDCAEQVLADAKVCKHCGYRFVEKPSTKALKLAAVAVVALVAFGAFYWWQAGNSRRRADERISCITEQLDTDSGPIDC